MVIQSAREASSWLKSRRAAGKALAEASSVAWPEQRDGVIRLARRVAALSSWSGGAVVLERPGMPAREGLDKICRLHASYGHPTTYDDIQLGSAPGHVFDEAPRTNRDNVTCLLAAMMLGHLEGRLVSKSGDFVAVFGCGVISFQCRNKSMAGKLRTLLNELDHANDKVLGTRGRRTRS